jgi:hypothetical protein
MVNLYFNVSVPLIIPNENQLKCQGMKIEKMAIEALFEGATSKGYLETKESNTQILGTTKEEFKFNDLIEKTWFISFFHNEKYINYGPMNTYKVFMFLKNMYLQLPKFEKEKKNFMVVDFVCDVHFQPDTLYEILTAEFENIKKKNVDSARMLLRLPETNKNTLNAQSNNSRDLLFFRKLEGIKTINSQKNEKYLNKLNYAQKENCSYLSNHRKILPHPLFPFSKFSHTWRKNSGNYNENNSTNYSSASAKSSEIENNLWSENSDTCVKNTEKKKAKILFGSIPNSY